MKGPSLALIITCESSWSPRAFCMGRLIQSGPASRFDLHLADVYPRGRKVRGPAHLPKCFGYWSSPSFSSRWSASPTRTHSRSHHKCRLDSSARAPSLPHERPPRSPIDSPCIHRIPERSYRSQPEIRAMPLTRSRVPVIRVLLGVRYWYMAQPFPSRRMTIALEAATPRPGFPF